MPISLKINFALVESQHDPGRARNDELLKNIMNFVKDKLVDEELDNEDPFPCV